MPDPDALRISVALCTYNGSAFIRQQLQSIARQTRPPDELIVCDDASTDQTRELLADFASAVPFPVSVVTHPTTLGPGANFEQAIQLCTGDLIALADQDDIWELNKLAKQARQFRNDPAVGYVFSDADVIDDDGRPLHYRLWESIGFGIVRQEDFRATGGLPLLSSVNVVTGATLMFRASLRDWLLPIPASWVHDGWIAALLSCSRLGGVPIREPLVRYRRHGAQLIGTSRRTLARQLATARVMNEAYFQKELDAWQALQNRLNQKTVPVRDETIARQIDEKIRHLRQRLDMRRGSRFGRLTSIATELSSGRYHTCSMGWKSIVQDALL